MKSLIQIITVLVMLNLATVNCASDVVETPPKNVDTTKSELNSAKKEMDKAEQKMNEAAQEMEKAAQKMEQALKIEAEEAEREAGRAQREAERAMREAQRETERALSEAQRKAREEQRRLYRIELDSPELDSPQYNSAGNVLVIPATEIELQDLAMIMEDMTVMSRILDKKLSKSQTDSGHFFSKFDFGSGFPFSWQHRETECIFMDGYGALFLMKVDFPLSSPAEVYDQEESKEDIDQIWEETKQELYTPKDVKKRRRKKDSSAEKYDAEKVEELKEDLVKALRHAANIRSLKPDQWIILTVTGGDGQGCLVTKIKSVSLVIKGDKTISAETPVPAPSTGIELSSPTVLTMRVKKSDVDAFSKDKLDFDQFRRKVQIFTY